MYSIFNGRASCALYFFSEVLDGYLCVFFLHMCAHMQAKLGSIFFSREQEHPRLILCVFLMKTQLCHGNKRISFLSWGRECEQEWGNHHRARHNKLLHYCGLLLQVTMAGPLMTVH